MAIIGRINRPGNKSVGPYRQPHFLSKQNLTSVWHKSSTSFWRHIDVWCQLGVLFLQPHQWVLTLMQEWLNVQLLSKGYSADSQPALYHHSVESVTCGQYPSIRPADFCFLWGQIALLHFCTLAITDTKSAEAHWETLCFNLRSNCQTDFFFFFTKNIQKHFLISRLSNSL